MAQTAEKIKEIRDVPDFIKERRVTKEKIQDRIKLLEKEKEQVKSAVLAYEGALQDCHYWLEQMEKPTVKNDRQDNT